MLQPIENSDVLPALNGRLQNLELAQLLRLLLLLVKHLFKLDLLSKRLLELLLLCLQILDACSHFISNRNKHVSRNAEFRLLL